jgi:hypothetical protein
MKTASARNGDLVLLKWAILTKRTMKVLLANSTTLLYNMYQGTIYHPPLQIGVFDEF